MCNELCSWPCVDIALRRQRDQLRARALRECLADTLIQARHGSLHILKGGVPRGVVRVPALSLFFLESDWRPP